MVEETMKVVVSNDDGYVVVLGPNACDNDKRKPCNWTLVCPIKNGKKMPCSECPATPCTLPRMTHAEAVEWWRKQ